MSDLTRSNAESLRQWFRECPQIARDKKTGLDYLADEATEYSIYTSPSTLAYKENILGERVLDDIQTENYIFAARMPYGPQASQNAANLLFYEQVCAWIYEQSAAQNLPAWNGGRVTAIEPTLTAYPAAVGANAAKYQIQLKVTYRRT